MSTPVSPFVQTNWQPAVYSQLMDEVVTSEIAETGYVLLSKFFSNDLVEKIRKIYAGSQNMQSEVAEIVQPQFKRLFRDYKIVNWAFAVKKAGAEGTSSFYQEKPVVDEWKWAPVRIAIALDKVGIENGAMQVLPKSHYTIPPYRLVDNESPFNTVAHLASKYVRPVLMDAGDLLIFDSRIFHNSLSNTSGSDRVVLTALVLPLQSEEVSGAGEAINVSEEQFRHFVELAELKETKFLKEYKEQAHA